MGTPFKMKGSAFYGKGNQSPASQIGGLPEKVAPVKPKPTAPAAPAAASLDYVNPTESPSPVSQVATKTRAGDVDEVTRNKIEAYQAKAAQGGPIEQSDDFGPKTKKKKKTSRITASGKKVTTTRTKRGHQKKKTVVNKAGNEVSTYTYGKSKKGGDAPGVKKSKVVVTNKGGTKTTTKKNWKTGKSVTRVNKPGFQISDLWGGKKVKTTQE